MSHASSAGLREDALQDSGVSGAVHRAEGWFALTYFAAYLAYLFWHPESEALHWVSLVAVPLLLVFLI